MKRVNVFLILLIVSIAALIAQMAIGFAVFTSSQANPYSWMNQMFHNTGYGGNGGMMGQGGSTSVNPLMPYFGALFIVLVSLVIVGVIGLTYYLVYPQIPVGTIHNAENQPATNSASAYASVAKTLTPEELKVITALNAHNGKYLQKYISKETGLSRLKTHRIIARLAQREIVTLEKVGNTNQVTFADWLKQEK
jgi:hypothetical protein